MKDQLNSLLDDIGCAIIILIIAMICTSISLCGICVHLEEISYSIENQKIKDATND